MKLTSVFAIAVIAVCVTAAMAASDTKPMDEFFTQTDGANWKNSTGWSGSTVKGRFGITEVASGIYEKVEKLALSGNNLGGSIAINLGELNKLTTFDVSSNSIGGALPSSSGSSTLTTLSFAENKFTGAINWASLATTLQTLNVSGNAQLTGTLTVAALAPFTSLTDLDLRGTGILANVSLFHFDPTIPVVYPGNFWCPTSTLVGFPATLKIQYDASLYGYQGCSCDFGYLGTIPGGCVDVDTPTRAALTAFFNSTDGAHWTVSTGWNSDMEVWMWYGVEVSNFTGATSGMNIVTGLRLPGNNLTGEIVIGAIGVLQELDLSGNNLFGELPALPESLQNLNVSDNELLNGTFPIAWAKAATKLSSVDVRGTQLTGSASDITFGSMWFSYGPYKCPQSGTINGTPATIFIDPIYFSYTACECWDLYTGVAPNCQSERDVLVAIYNATNGAHWLNTWALNITSDDLCTQWAGVKCVDGHVTELDLSNNNLIGVLPADWSVLSYLTSVVVSGNTISGAFPTTFGPAITTLSFATNPFDGHQVDWSSLGSLTTLVLANTNLMGSFNFSLVPKTLQVIDISSNAHLNGSLDLTWINADAALTNVYIQRTGMTAQNLSTDVAFSVAATVDYDDEYSCNQTTLVGVPANVSVLYSASYFGYTTCVCEEGFTGAAPDCVYTEAGERSALVGLYNALGGDKWTNNTNWLSQKSICTWFGVGCRPDGTQGGEVVDSLVLSGNNLVGVIPNVFQNLSTLVTIDLSNNVISGALPTSLAAVVDLTTLKVAKNSMSFGFDNATQTALPTSLVNVDISGNDGVVGALPFKWLSTADSLKKLNVLGTSLRGPAQDPTLLLAFNTSIPIDYGTYWCPTASIPTVPSLINLRIDPAYYGFSECTCDTDYSGSAPLCANEFTILVDLYNATGGPSWTNNNNWNISDASSNVCTWFGVCCKATSGAQNCSTSGPVAGINLSSNNLVGELPASLNNLYNLTSLNVSSNKLSGEIPVLSGLPLLAVIDLSSNAFSGNVTDDLFPLTVGSLVLSNNADLTGPLPYAWIIENKNLFWLAALSTGLHEIANKSLSPLEYDYKTVVPYPTLHFGCNPFFINGKTGAALGLAVSLTYTDYATCNCSFAYAGPVPTCTIDEAGALKLAFVATAGDKWLNRAGWNFTMPSANGDLEAAVWNKCAAYGVCCGNLSLYDPKTGVCDVNATNVVGLFLGGNNLNGQLPTEIGLLTETAFVQVSTNPFLGTLPTEIGSLQSLVVLDLSETVFTGSVPTTLASVKTLEELRLDSTHLKFDIVDGYKNSSLAVVTVANVELVSGLPMSVVATWTNLETLDVSSTKLAGGIPDAIFTLPKLQRISAASNALTGTIPDSIGNAHILKVDLSGNKLTGSIPAAFANATSLLTLILSDNQLTGPIPTVFAALTALKKLEVDDNSLSGVLSVANLPPNASVIQVSGNEGINGTFPIDYVKNNKDLLEIDCSGTALSVDAAALVFSNTTTVHSLTGHYWCWQAEIKGATSVVVQVDPESYGFLQCSCDSGYNGIVANGCKKNKSSQTGLIVGVVVGCVGAVFVALGIVWFIRRRKSSKYEDFDEIHV